jgi:hypothetical protein
LSCPLPVDDHQRPAEQFTEATDTLAALSAAIEGELRPHEREVLVATAINGVPIDVLAEWLGTTRGALYKTVQAGRQKLRAVLGARSLEHRLTAGAAQGTGRRPRLGTHWAQNGPIRLRSHQTDPALERRKP